MRTATGRYPATTDPGGGRRGDDHPDGAALGRRQLLQLGAAGAAAGILAATLGPSGLVVRAADPAVADPGSGRRLDPDRDPVEPESFLVPVLPRARVLSANFSAFTACDYDSATLAYAYDGTPAVARGTVFADSGWLHAPMPVPAGARILRVDVFGRRTTAGPQTWKLQTVPVFAIDIADPVVDLAVIGVASTTGPTHGTVQPAEPLSVLTGWGYSLVLLGSTPQNQAAGFIVQYDLPLVELAGDGTAIVGASGVTTAPAGPGNTGIYGLATTGTAGWFATADPAAGFALRVTGRVRLDSCAGTAMIEDGSRSVTVTPGIDLTAGSAVTATLQGSAGGTTTVHRVIVDTAADTFRIYLTKAATRRVKVAWHVFG